MSKFLVMILALLTVIESTQAQILPVAKHSFEKLTWGQLPDSVQIVLGQKKMVELTLPTTGPFSELSSKVRCYQYEDTLLAHVFFIMLAFNQSDSKLIAITLTGGRSEMKKKESDFGNLWDDLKNYFGKPVAEKSIPLVGESLEWRSGSTKVMMMRFSLMGNSLSLNFSPLGESK